jgi:dCTP deaminase
MIRVKNMRTIVSPWYPEFQGPNSYDLRIGGDFLLPVKYRLPRTLLKDELEYVEKKDEVVLHKNDFALGTTIESVKIPEGKCAQVIGRSSVGRWGIMVHVTSGFIDSGFEGQITLEIVNVAPYMVRLTKGMRIAQLIVMDAETDHMYDGHYQKQTGTTRPAKQ